MNKAMIYIREIVMKFSKETKEIIVQTDFLNLIETELNSIAAMGNRIEKYTNQAFLKSAANVEKFL